jgi:hypothetical protein
MSEIYKLEFPSERGWYWIKSRRSGAESIHYVDLVTRYWIDDFLSHYLIGPRIPSAEQCSELAHAMETT